MGTLLQLSPHGKIPSPGLRVYETKHFLLTNTHNKQCRLETTTLTYSSMISLDHQVKSVHRSSHLQLRQSLNCDGSKKVNPLRAQVAKTGMSLHSGRWCRHNLATVCDGKFWRHLVMPVQPHIYLLIPCCFIFRYVVVMYSLLLFDVLRYFCVKLLINSTITVVVSRFLC